jgi:dynein heavy chain
MEAVCILLGHNPDWQNAQKVLANVNFLKSLKEFDKDNIDGKVIKKLLKYTSDPELTEERMMNVSKAATAILMWVNAMVEYSKVAKVVAPKKAKLEQMNQLLTQANSKLQEKQSQLGSVVDQVRGLKETCEKTMNEKSALHNKLTQTEKRLERASKLISGLAGEEIRWKQEEKALQDKLSDIIGNVFISAAAINYYGPFVSEYRESLIAQWHAKCSSLNLPTSQQFSLLNTLGSAIEIRNWNINGLPSDSSSVDSAILIKRSLRFPLCIDPQQQAKRWLKAENKNRLLITKFTSKDMLRSVEIAVRTGLTLIIEDIGENLEAAIDPILLRQTFIKGAQKYIRLADSDIEYHDSFRLFLLTKYPNPHYLPEQQIKVCLINFTVTTSGLEEQLLVEVVKKERADIEEKSNRLILLQAKDSTQLHEIEDRILLLLTETQGNLLDDENLIETLEESKFTSNVIMERVKESQITQADLAVIRNSYRSIAARGSILYFVMSDLALIDPMYQYSLNYFIRLFNLSIQQAPQSTELALRLHNLLDFITCTVYSNISRGLFERHKLLFSFLITSSIHRAAGRISPLQWHFLLRNNSLTGLNIDLTTASINPLPELITKQSWEFLCTIEKDLSSSFQGITNDFSVNVKSWKSFVQHSTPQSIPLPGSWNTKLKDFDRFLLVKALRQEKLLFAFADYVREHMGEQFLNNNSAAANTLEEIYKDSDNSTPIIFVLSPGADPTQLLFRFAKEKGFDNKLQVISLGQGQGENAVRLIESAKSRGDWVLLQNCHLAKSWMNTLDDLVLQLQQESNHATGSSELDEEKSSAGYLLGQNVLIHNDFRLWLTSMPATYFPVSVLQRGIKLTNEPPSGIRANMLRSYKNLMTAEELQNSCPTNNATFKKLLFGLTFFHSVIQERKKFGPLGWCKAYEFNDSDLETSINTLKLMLNDLPANSTIENIPLDSLKYLTGEINWGGRVTDFLDRRCLQAILDTYITPQIFSDAYKFSSSGLYYAPHDCSLDEYISYLESLPVSDAPDIFGMHENANLAYQSKSTNELIDTILSIQPRQISSTTGDNISSDELVANIANELTEKLPALLDKSKLKAANHRTNNINNDSSDEEELVVVYDSLTIVLLQEVDRFNNLLSVMKGSLSDIQRAIKGEIVMSADLDLMYSALLNNSVPTLWSRVSYPSLKPLASWIADLQARILFIAEWLIQGKPNAYWLSGLFFPQGFLTAVLQTHARKYTIAIDTLLFNFNLLDNIYDKKAIETPPSDGVYIYGLFMDGARWDTKTHTVQDCLIGELYSPVPAIHFIPTQLTSEVSSSRDSSSFLYECPVFKTSIRAGVLSTTGHSTNYILSVALPSTQPSNYWILKGAAMLTQLDS